MRPPRSPAPDVARLSGHPHPRATGTGARAAQARALYAQPAPELTLGLVAAHGALLDALRSRDPAVCTAAVRSHIETKIAQMSNYAH